MTFCLEEMKANGFSFNFKEARSYTKRYPFKVETLVFILQTSFPPKTFLYKEITQSYQTWDYPKVDSGDWKTLPPIVELPSRLEGYP